MSLYSRKGAKLTEKKIQEVGTATGIKYVSIEWSDCTSKCQQLTTNDRISFINDTKVLRICVDRFRRPLKYLKLWCDFRRNKIYAH